MNPIPLSTLNTFLAKNYSLGDVIDIQPITTGEENSNFFVTTGGERYVLRIYSTHHSTTGLRKLPEIEFELDFMEAAQAHGVPTPPVIHPRQGDRAATLSHNNQSHFSVLFGYAQGKEAAEYSAETARVTAETLLALRRVSTAFHRPSTRSWPGDIVRVSLDFYVTNRERLSQALGSNLVIMDDLFQAASTGYAQVQTAKLPTGVIHGDVKLGNLLFESGRITAVIDFDDYSETFLLEEFTRTVMHDLDSPTRNVIRAGYFPQFHDALAADPAVTADETAHLGTFLRARLVYDLSSYALAGPNGLVDEVLSNPHVKDVILTGL